MVYLSGIFEPHAYYDLLNCILSCPHLAELRLAFCKINTKKKRELKFITTFSQELGNHIEYNPLIDPLAITKRGKYSSNQLQGPKVSSYVPGLLWWI